MSEGFPKIETKEKKQEHFFIENIRKNIDRIQKDKNWDNFSDERKNFEIKWREEQIKLIDKIIELDKKGFDVGSMIQRIYDISLTFSENRNDSTAIWKEKIDLWAEENNMNDESVEKLKSVLD